jgi:acetyl-CoA carboxylase biotin carboxyl carrier protein
MLMDIERLKQILDLVREQGLAEFEIEADGLRLRIRREASSAAASVAPHPAMPPVGRATPASHALSPLVPAVVSAESDATETEIELAVVKSPIVGTFYRSPEPGAPPFVDVGSRVTKGQVLCIIEAMKLMNEIDAECDGEVVNIYVESGQPVQYGERLFAIRTQ